MFFKIQFCLSFFFGHISTKYFVIENFISRYSYIKKERKKESMLNIRVKKKNFKKTLLKEEDYLFKLRIQKKLKNTFKNNDGKKC